MVLCRLLGLLVRNVLGSMAVELSPDAAPSRSGKTALPRGSPGVQHLGQIWAIDVLGGGGGSQGSEPQGAASRGLRSNDCSTCPVVLVILLVFVIWIKSL